MPEYRPITRVIAEEKAARSPKHNDSVCIPRKFNSLPTNASTSSPRRPTFTVSRASQCPTAKKATPAGPFGRHCDPSARVTVNRCDINLDVQKALVAEHNATQQRDQLAKWALASRVDPSLSRQHLRFLVVESYIWRQQEARKLERSQMLREKEFLDDDNISEHSQNLSDSESDSSTPSSPWSSPPPVTTFEFIPVPAKPVPNAPVLDVHTNQRDFDGIMDDIDTVMLSDEVLLTNDKKNMYQKVLLNLGQLGLFRPQLQA